MKLLKDTLPNPITRYVRPARGTMRDAGRVEKWPKSQKCVATIPKAALAIPIKITFLLFLIMNIVYTTEAADFPVVVQATVLANQLLTRPDFYAGITQQQQFDLSTATPTEVAEILRTSPLTFIVDLFTPGLLGGMLRYRRTLAYTDSAHPNTLFLNSRKLNRDAEEIAATIIHESVHAADDAELNYTFGHGNNSAVGKENTAPYWIGNYAYQLLLGATGAPVAALVFDQEDNRA